MAQSRVPSPANSARSRLGALGWLVAGAAVVLATLGSAAGSPVRAATTARPFAMLQSVPWQDIRDNTHNICDGSFTHVLKNVSANSNLQEPVTYLNEAQKCGLKVVFHFSGTISGGTVYPSRVATWVKAVKSHPMLEGYLTVKEPSWIGINATEIRSLYSAFKAADPYHRVFALFGDIPHFGDSVNPYTAGMADVVIVDWYPSETANGGCSTTGYSYVANGPKWYAKVRSVIDARTPGSPLIGMIQTHKYLAPSCHKKQLPTKSILFQMANEALVSGKAQGLAFHTWTNTNYQMDQRRNPTMVSWMKELSRTLAATVISGPNSRRFTIG